MRILFQSRKETFTNRGGDTVVVEKFADGLRRFGVDLTIDTEGTVDPAGFDLVHLFNLMVRPETDNFAAINVQRGARYVVTSLFEDWPIFFNQMVGISNALVGYVMHGQQEQTWLRLKQLVAEMGLSDPRTSPFVTEHAVGLFASGIAEAALIRKYHPRCGPIVLHSFGSDISTIPGDPHLFRKAYDLDDYIICVGRVEFRKNQMMILKALEDSPLTVVFIASKFTYQPEYLEAAKRFKRKGKTIFIERVDEAHLASAYAGSLAHVLPSWYELPGLVTIEAARFGTNIVVSELGTIRDYVGEAGFYCDPADELSVRSAIEKACAAPRNPALAAAASRFTWKRSVEKLLSYYADIISGRGLKNCVSESEVLSQISPYRIVEDISKRGIPNCQISIEALNLSLPTDESSALVLSQALIDQNRLADAFYILVKFNKLYSSETILMRLGELATLYNSRPWAYMFYDAALKVNPENLEAEFLARFALSANKADEQTIERIMHEVSPRILNS